MAFAGQKQLLGILTCPVTNRKKEVNIFVVMVGVALDCGSLVVDIEMLDPIIISFKLPTNVYSYFLEYSHYPVNNPYYRCIDTLFNVCLDLDQTCFPLDLKAI